MDEQGKFSVFTSSYVNTAINQSAFRILKCYIIKYYKIAQRLIRRLGNSNMLKAKKLKDYKRISARGIIFSVNFVASYIL